MKLSARTIQDRNEWNAFFSSAAPQTFLQSWEWGVFQESLGEQVFHVGIYGDDTLVGIALFILVRARRGTFLLCPHGPILPAQHEAFEMLLDEAKRIAKNECCQWIRVCPLAEDTREARDVLKASGFRRAPIHMHPELSWLLDLSSSEEELLSHMRKTTRYSIKKAVKDGVVVLQSSTMEDVEKFYQVYQETVDRQHFVAFSKKYLAQELAAFGGGAVFFFAVHNGRILATALIVFAGRTAFYHHGASSQKDTKIPAAYLLQWEAIREAKRRGCTTYNFWGIAPEGKPKHPWAGLSLFKKGFGGFSEQYVPAHDYALSWRYWLNYVIEYIRRKRRHL